MSLPPAIRHATVEDTRAVSELLRLLGYPVDAAAVGGYIAAGRAANDCVLLVAERTDVEAQRVVGMVAVSERPVLTLGGRVGTVEALIVAPDARRAGTGTRLLRHVKGLAAALGWVRLETAIGPHRDAHTREFMLERGFVVAETTCLRWDPLEDKHPPRPYLPRTGRSDRT